LEQSFVQPDLLRPTARGTPTLQRQTGAPPERWSESSFEDDITWRRNRSRENTVTPDELLHSIRQTIITGQPGSGKTTLLRHLALRTLADANTLPIFLELKRVTSKDLIQAQGNFSTLLFSLAIGTPLGLTEDEEELFHEYFLDRLHRKLTPIFLDGLDESSMYEWFPLLCRAINTFLESACGHNIVVITSRPYAAYVQFHTLTNVSMAPLTRRQIQRYLSLYYDHNAEQVRDALAHIQHHPSVAALAQVPLMLGIIAHLYITTTPLAETRLELYQQIVHELITQMDRRRSVERFHIDDPEGLLKTEFLSQLAYDTLVDGGMRARATLVISDEAILKKAIAFCRSFEIKPHNKFAADVMHTALLVGVGGQYSFAHPSIHEYLAARWLAQLPQRNDRLMVFCRAYFDTAVVESEVLPMAFGLSDEPQELYRIVEKLPDSLSFANLRLRARALAYTKEIDSVALTELSARLFDFVSQPSFVETPHVAAVVDSFIAAEGTIREVMVKRLSSLGEGASAAVRIRLANIFGRFSGITAIFALLRILELDSDSDVRRGAALSLRQIGDDRAVAGLVSALNDECVYVREMAAGALGLIGDESAIGPLIKALGEKKHDCGEDAAEALRRIGGNKVIEMLARAIDAEADLRTRGQAVRVLASIGGEDVQRLILKASYAPNAYIRKTAIRSLQCGPALVVERLLGALADEDSGVRQASSGILSRLKGGQVIEGLWSTLQNHSGDADLEARAISILGTLCDKEHVPDIATRLNGDDPRVREAAIDALKKINTQAAEHALVGAMDSCFPEVRRQAACALGTVVGELSRWRLLDGLRDEDREFACEAADSLRQRHYRDEALGEILVDLDGLCPQTRQIVADILGEVGSKKAVGWLVDRLKDKNEDTWVRIRSAMALEQTFFEEGRDALVEASQDGDVDVRIHALDSLCGVSDERALYAQIRALRDPDDFVCAQAPRRLEKMGDERAVPGLIEVLYAKRRKWGAISNVERALCVIGGKRAMEALVNAPTRGQGGHYGDVPSLICLMRSASAVFGLLELLRDRDRDNRVRAVRALAGVCKEEFRSRHVRSADDFEAALSTADEVLFALADPDPEVASATYDAVEKMTERRYWETNRGVVEKLRDRHSNLCRDIGIAIERVGRPRIVTELLYLLDSEVESVRLSAAEALAGIDRDGLCLGLWNALDDCDALVRLRAVRVIGYYYTSPDLATKLSDLASLDSEDSVRTAARATAAAFAHKLSQVF
jgi:HEAT repeat protein